MIVEAEDCRTIRFYRKLYTTFLLLVNLCTVSLLLVVVVRGSWGFDVFVYEVVACCLVALVFLFLKFFFRLR